MVDFREVNTVVHHYCLKLRERLVYYFLEDTVGSKANLLPATDDNPFTGIHIDALAVLYGHHLESTEPPYLQKLVRLQRRAGHIKHLPYKRFGISQLQSALFGEGLCQYGDTRSTAHRLFLHSLVSP